jgi:hypothetical protein
VQLCCPALGHDAGSWFSPVCQDISLGAPLRLELEQLCCPVLGCPRIIPQTLQPGCSNCQAALYHSHFTFHVFPIVITSNTTLPPYPHMSNFTFQISHISNCKHVKNRSPLPLLFYLLLLALFNHGHVTSGQIRPVRGTMLGLGNTWCSWGYVILWHP